MNTPQQPAKPSGATPAQLQQMGKTVVGQLYMVLRTVKIHDSFNQAMLLATENLKDQLNLAWTSLGGVKLEFIEDQVYLNDTRIRLDAQSLDNVKDLGREFRARGLGGLTFKRRVTTEGIRALVQLFMQARPNDAAAAAMLREQLGQLRDLALDILGPRTFSAGQKSEPAQLQVDPRLWALQTYAKAVMAVKRFVTEDQGDAGTDPRLKLTRIVQDLVDISSGNASLLFRMCSIKDASNYVYNHAVNCAVLSIAMGQAMGLSRLDLMDLGMSAMCADLGFTQGNLLEVVDKKDLTMEDRVALAQHGLRAVQLLLGRGALNRNSMRRVITAFQHHVHHNRLGGYPMGQRRNPLHLFSRIVAIVDNYDALTTNRPWREAYPPAEALQIMRQDAGTKFDPVLLRIFVNMLGIYPLGTRVRLNTGEVAEVYHVPAEAELLQHPVVKVVVDAQGQPVVGRTLVRDLADWDAQLRPRYWIEGMLE